MALSLTYWSWASTVSRPNALAETSGPNSGAGLAFISSWSFLISSILSPQMVRGESGGASMVATCKACIEGRPWEEGANALTAPKEARTEMQSFMVTIDRRDNRFTCWTFLLPWGSWWTKILQRWCAKRSIVDLAEFNFRVSCDANAKCMGWGFRGVYAAVLLYWYSDTSNYPVQASIIEMCWRFGLLYLCKFNRYSHLHV